MKSRTFNIMQYEKHPISGEPLLNEDTITKALAHKSIKEWAYICHDKDVYSEKDEVDSNGTYEAGKTKPRHWHIVFKAGYAIDVAVIARWFGIAENFVDVPKGAGAFLDCVQYLTHEDEKQQGLGKRLYEDEEVTANFDFRMRLDKRTENRLKYGTDLDPKDQMRHNVLYGGWSMLECEKADPLTYMADLDRLKHYRLDYLQTRAPMPPLRINYYVDGLGGIGKNTASRALAKSLFPDYQGQCFFEVGGDKVSFEGYDGEPVIIWNDRRAAGFISAFGREETFDIFDSHPTDARHHIKYGSVRLVNAVNIVNGVEPYQQFLDGLAGEYKTRDGQEMKAEDKGQAYRRFPIILCLRENDFDVLLNRGVAEGTREYEQYIGYRQIVGSFGELAKRLEGRAREVVEINMLKPALELTEKVKQIEGKKIEDPDEIPDEFKEYGQQVKPDRQAGGIKNLIEGDDNAKKEDS